MTEEKVEKTEHVITDTVSETSIEKGPDVDLNVNNGDPEEDEEGS